MFDPHGTLVPLNHPHSVAILDFVMDYDSYDAILHHIFQQTQGDVWFMDPEDNVAAGVCLRVAPGHFRLFPYENQFLAPFETAIRALNPVVAVKIRSAAVHVALALVYGISFQP